MDSLLEIKQCVWVGDENHNKSFFSEISNLGIHLHIFQAESLASRAKEILPDTHVFIFDCSIGIQDCIDVWNELFAWKWSAFPNSPLLVIVDDLNSESNSSDSQQRALSIGHLAVNAGKALQMIPLRFGFATLRLGLELAFSKVGSAKAEAKKIEKFRLQSSQLKELQHGMEKLVESHTQSQSHAKMKLEDKLKEMRAFNLFVKSLSADSNLEDLLKSLRKELRLFPSIKPPIFGMVTQGRVFQLSYLQGSDLCRLPVFETLFQRSLQIRINSLEDQKFLANLLSRPVGHVIMVPIQLLHRSDYEENSGPILFFEHGLSPAQLETFVHFVLERIQPFAVALDRILIENEMKESARHWESTFDAVPFPLAVVNSERKVLRANKAFDGEAGSSICHEQLFGKSSLPCVGCPLENSLKGFSSQPRVIRDSGRAYEVHSFPISFSLGSPSEFGNTAQAAVNYYRDLARDFQLKSQIIQQEKMAALGRLAGRIAHELNNPLTGIRSLAQVLVSEIESANTKSSQLSLDLREVENAAERCQGIIKNLLEFATGNLESLRTRVTLQDLVQRTLPLLKTAMRGLNSEIHLNSEMLWVEVNIQLIQQVVFNLVVNACQAMGNSGTVTIKVSPVVDMEEREWVRLEVQDTGPGIPKSIQESIFDAFFTTKPKGEGTGLGLSMCKDVVLKMDGRIFVQSEPGQPTCFTIDLPRVREQIIK